MCGSCWAFSVTALIESMIRIQHGVWSKRSEADVFEASSATCTTGWYPGWALELIKGNRFGLTDTKCTYDDPGAACYFVYRLRDLIGIGTGNIYYDSDRPFLGCGDRQGRALRIGDYATIEGRDDARW